MALYAMKVVLSAAIIVIVTELSKRQAWWGALLASLPLISVLSMVWLYVDTGDTTKVSSFAWGVFWLVLPSLALFVVMPVLFRAGWGFYLFESWLLPRVGVQI